jgi:hypothetical protein
VGRLRSYGIERWLGFAPQWIELLVGQRYSARDRTCKFLGVNSIYLEPRYLCFQKLCASLDYRKQIIEVV